MSLTGIRRSLKTQAAAIIIFSQQLKVLRLKEEERSTISWDKEVWEQQKEQPGTPCSQRLSSILIANVRYWQV